MNTIAQTKVDDQLANIEEFLPSPMLEWQREWLGAALQPGVQIAAASLGRGSGKTQLMGALAASAISPSGCLFKPAARIMVASASTAQATLVLRDVATALGIDPNNKGEQYGWRYQESAQRNRITHLATDTYLDLLSSSSRQALGYRPDLVICDEPAAWPPNDGAYLYAALKTSLTKRPNACLLYTSPSPRDRQKSRMPSSA